VLRERLAEALRLVNEIEETQPVGELAGYDLATGFHTAEIAVITSYQRIQVLFRDVRNSSSILTDDKRVAIRHLAPPPPEHPPYEHPHQLDGGRPLDTPVTAHTDPSEPGSVTGGRAAVLEPRLRNRTL